MRTQNLILVRPGFNYKLNSKYSVAGGYSYLRSFQSESQFKIENRFWQQLTYSPNFKKVDLSSRIRIEQRNSFLKKDEENTEKLPYENRYRIQLRWDKNLRRKSSNSPYVTVNDEFMFHSPIVLKNVTFDQNRLYGGLGYKFSDLFRLELGYMYVYQPIQKSELIKINHQFVLNINTIINLQKED
jgi:long-subunit fatty acid transport protein